MSFSCFSFFSTFFLQTWFFTDTDDPYYQKLTSKYSKFAKKKNHGNL
jgi:hypothetical protein